MPGPFLLQKQSLKIDFINLLTKISFRNFGNAI